MGIGDKKEKKKNNKRHESVGVIVKTYAGRISTAPHEGHPSSSVAGGLIRESIDPTTEWQPEYIREDCSAATTRRRHDNGR